MTKALFINGGPRKNKNTVQVMEKAMESARDAGTEVEIVHLYDLNFKGCKEHFPIDLQNAYELGKRLVEKAKEQ